jgi:hypothetical protein
VEQAIDLIRRGKMPHDEIEMLDRRMSAEKRLRVKDEGVRWRMLELQLLVDSHIVGKKSLERRRTNQWKKVDRRNVQFHRSRALVV